MKTLIKLTLLLILISAAGESFAACNISTSGISFGSYNVFNPAPVNTIGTITISCTLLTILTTTEIGPSTNSGGFNPRQMKHSSQSDRLNYNLFTNSSRTTIWGNGTGGTATITCTVLLSLPCTLTVYAQIPALQNVSVGSYSDTVTITVLP